MSSQNQYLEEIKEDIGYFRYDLYILAIATLSQKNYNRLYEQYLLNLIRQDYKQTRILSEVSNSLLKKIELFFLIPLLIFLLFLVLISHQIFLINEDEFLEYLSLIFLILCFLTLDSFSLIRQLMFQNNLKNLSIYLNSISLFFFIISFIILFYYNIESADYNLFSFSTLEGTIFLIVLLSKLLLKNLYFDFQIPLLYCYFFSKISSLFIIVGVILITINNIFFGS